MKNYFLILLMLNCLDFIQAGVEQGQYETKQRKRKKQQIYSLTETDRLERLVFQNNVAELDRLIKSDDKTKKKLATLRRIGSYYAPLLHIYDQHPEMTKLLLEAGCSAACKDDIGETTLWVVVQAALSRSKNRYPAPFPLKKERVALIAGALVQYKVDRQEALDQFEKVLAQRRFANPVKESRTDQIKEILVSHRDQIKAHMSLAS